MAAATQTQPKCLVQNDANVVVSVRLSAMTSDQVENVSYLISRAPYAKPREVTMHIITEPTARCGLFMQCDPNAAVITPVATNRYVPVRVYTEAGGDITGAVVEIHMSFDAIYANS
jgi:hypothetical protein